MKTILLLLLLTLARSASARLGETLEQVTQRYGAPLATSGIVAVPAKPVPATIGTSTHSKAGIDITVHFHNGIAEKIVFSKPNGFSEVEKRILMDANAGGGTWTAIGQSSFASQGQPERIIRLFRGSIGAGFLETETIGLKLSTITLKSAALEKRTAEAEATKRQDELKDF